MPSDKKIPRSTFTIALSGILIALGWLFVIVSGVLPTGRLFFLLLASLVVATAYFEMQLSGAIYVALGISLLSLTYPGLIHAAAFAIFAGPLPLLILQLNRREIPKFLQYLLTHIVMSLLLASVLSILGLNNFIMNRLNVETWQIWLIVFVAFQIVLIIYRHIIFNHETFYQARINPWLRKKR